MNAATPQIRLYGYRDNAVLSGSAHANTILPDELKQPLDAWDMMGSPFDHSLTALSYNQLQITLLDFPLAIPAIYYAARLKSHLPARIVAFPRGMLEAKWFSDTAASLSSLEITPNAKRLGLAALRAASRCRSDPPEIFLMEDGALILEYNDLSKIVSVKIVDQEAFLSVASSEMEVSTIIFEANSSAELLEYRFLFELGS
ncbi:hypothetical protein [Mesorhizobium neociceri]|uniref:Uncharacterized protein n=1 Tax=Mesorhizobium neociceri TaxID=1307853 RepID=A0A838BEC4_9HYPH|nr:hypothetical protein [Mesorhizobium neociceri]MBA1144593.1 hypothetical protein [Mesorhizobium neociceri]